ncbi:MAG: PEP-CTERM sorting domain-containing protein [Sedimentisphaerales bacterium]|nr:PEP-CTERM sorting domain-containing protein [Sedimentisphaerales bacterium]
MKKKSVYYLILILALFVFNPDRIQAQPYSIYDIQYTANGDGASDYADVVLDCTGGVVIHKYDGFNKKLTLYNPAYSDGWGGLVVKDFTENFDLFSNVTLGDWVSFSDILVEEYRGNTQLVFDDTTGGFSVDSSGNSLPAPLLVSPDDIAAPLYQDAPTAGWFVSDHVAERYEAMYLLVEDVTVTGMDLGKAGDNYVLENDLGFDCWAADYMNIDAGGPYHSYISLGAELLSVSGIIEQYTNTSSGWDYYQMLTLTSADMVPEPGSMILLLTGSAIFFRKKQRL